MSASMEELLAKFRAEALVRGEAWLRGIMADILEDKRTAADTEDAQPCDKKVRPLEPMSPSPVPRTLCRVSSPDRNPPGPSTGQCPASEGLHPVKNPFILDSDLRTPVNVAHDEDLRISSDTTFTKTFPSDSDMRSLKNVAYCEDEESSTSSDGSSEWAATAEDNDITAVKEMNAKIQTEALVRGDNHLQDTVAEALEDEGAAADTEDVQPCAKKVRPLERRSPSPMPRTRCRLRSPDRNPPGAAIGHCPVLEDLHPGRKPFRLDSDLRNAVNEAHDEDLRTLFHVTFQRDADSGPSSAVAVTSSMANDESNVDHSGQNFISPCADSRTVQPWYNGNSGRVPILVHIKHPVEVPDAVRIARLFQSCSAAASLDRQHAPMPVSLSVPDLRPCLVCILGNSFVTSALERASRLRDGSQLGFPRSKAIIRWHGHKNLPWDSVRPAVAEYLQQCRPPDVLVVHIEEIEVCFLPAKDLIQYMRCEILSLRSMVPETVVVWSATVHRRKQETLMSMKTLDKIHNKLNNAVANHIIPKGVEVVRHRSLERNSDHLFAEDRVNLNSAGNDIWCNGIQEGIDKAIERWKQSHGIMSNHTM